MLKDLTPMLSKVNEVAPSFALDNYNLKAGLYFRFNMEKSPKENIRQGKYLVVGDKEDVSEMELRNWFKIRDYYSSMMNDDTNKAIDLPGKKIHSTNYLTLFAKKEIMFGETTKFSPEKMHEQIQTVLKDGIPKLENRLYELYPIQTRKKSERERAEKERDAFFTENYPSLLGHLEQPERTEEIEAIRNYWDRYYFEFIPLAQEIAESSKVTNYIKVFFDKDVDDYKQEYLLYILPRIFNVNTYNQIVDGEILGLPAYDISMNAKKPFYELKTTKSKVPTRVTLEQALLIKEVYSWLSKQGKFKDHIRPINDVFGVDIGGGIGRQVAHGAYHFRIDANGSIEAFDNVPFGRNENMLLTIDNIIGAQEKIEGISYKKSYDPITESKVLHHHISKLFFNNYLRGNLLGGDPPKANENVFTTEMQSIYVMTRQALYDYIYKGTSRNIQLFIDKYSLELIENQLLKTTQGLRYGKIADAYNFRLALINYEGSKEENDVADVLNNLQAQLSEKLEQSKTIAFCESDEEFFFLAGQVAYYLLSQSEASGKNYGMAEPILKVRDAERLKGRLVDLLEAYGHKVFMNNIRFNNAMAMVQGYDTKAKITGRNKSILIAGLLANNLFYQKIKEDDHVEVESND